MLKLQNNTTVIHDDLVIEIPYENFSWNNDWNQHLRQIAGRALFDDISSHPHDDGVYRFNFGLASVTIIRTFNKATGEFPSTTDFKQIVWLIQDALGQSRACYPSILGYLKRNYRSDYNENAAGRAFCWSPVRSHSHRLCTQP